ncbi:PIN domain-like protein [Gonapodya prolifera JEL478]|uniref:PIN domain-like protein n=1 Tax=Gonapodya prolifera (strain JEL478) TaxID=1344416 RepID=A0A139AXP5_GONPJ|nr:PIN domain-like protein [Gonapodya prolifera JEL478]|eukprot:KXS21508.1 PIN domain-like protein [Gonapodya prolifera JEL478]
MGVKGLWQLLEPVARPTRLDTLRNRVVAVDASIWLHQFIKAIKDSSGNPLNAAHILGFFRRICKLLFFNIKPVFVFDGGVPALKRATIAKRRERRTQVRDTIQRTAEKILQKQLQLHALGQLEAAKPNTNTTTAGNNYVYHDDIYAPPSTSTNPNSSPSPPNKNSMSAANRMMSGPTTNSTSTSPPPPHNTPVVPPAPSGPIKRKRPLTDEYDLPPMDPTRLTANGLDVRMATERDLRAFVQENRDFIDTLHMDSPTFHALPLEAQYEILQDARLRSRSTDHSRLATLLTQAPNSLEFSRGQIAGLVRRNELTQRVSEMVTGKPVIVKNRSGGKGAGAAYVPRRIAAERGREFVMVKNDERVGGWTIKMEEKAVGGIMVATGNRSVGEGVSVPQVKGGQRALAAELKKRLHRGAGTATADAGVPTDVIDLDDDEDDGRTSSKKISVVEDDDDEEFEDVVMDTVSVERAQTLTYSDSTLAIPADDELDQETLDMIAAINQITAAEEQRDAREVHHAETPKTMKGGRGSQSRRLLLSDSDDSELEDPAPKRSRGNSRTRNGVVASTIVAPIVVDEDERDNSSGMLDSLSPGDRVDDVSYLPPSVPTTASPHLDQPYFSGSPKVPLTPSPSSSPPAAHALASSDEFLASWTSMASASIRRTFPTVFPTPNNASLDTAMRQIIQASSLDDMAEEARAARRRLDKMAEADAMGGKGESVTFWAGFLEAAYGWKAEWAVRDGGPVDLVEENDVQEEFIDVAAVETYPIPQKHSEGVSGEGAVQSSGSPNGLRQKRRILDAIEIDSDEGDGDRVPNRVGDGIPLADSRVDQIGQRTSAELRSALQSSNGIVDDKHTPKASKATTMARMVLNPSVPSRMLLSSIISPRQQSRARGSLPQVVSGNVVRCTETTRADDFSNTNDGAAPGDITDAHSEGLQGLDAAGTEKDEEATFVVGDGDGGMEIPEEEAERVDVPIISNEEAEEYAKFVSSVANKDLSSVRADLELEVQQLHSTLGKNERHGQEVTDQMIADSQELLRLFGIPFVVATMEAEAQCAELLHLGLVEGIITDDSDVFLFGGDRVYRHVFNRDKYVECYLASDLSNDLKLDRETLIQLAYLLGSDYTEGIQGVGAVTALEVISAFASEEARDCLDCLQRFKEFHHRVANKRKIPEDDKGQRKRLQKLCSRIEVPEDFPNEHVRSTYMNPAVDSSSERFQFAPPDVDKLRGFLGSRLGWRQEKVDEVVLPIIRTMRQRESEGVQARIDQFLPVSPDASAAKKIKRLKSKRARKVFKSWTATLSDDDGEEHSDTDSEESKDQSPVKGRKSVARKTPKRRT